MKDMITDMIQNLASLYQYPLDTPALMLYQQALKHYSVNAIRRGIELCLQDEKFFPKPAAIIQAIARDRANNPPAPNRECSECGGCGFTNVYVKVNKKAMQEAKWNGRMPPTAEAIQRGFLLVITEEEYRNTNEAGIYSFAKRCEVCR